MPGRYLHSDSPSARRAAAIVYSVATGAAVFYWTVAGAGWPALRAGKIIDALLLLIGATMIWWLVAGVGLRIVGRFDASRRHASRDQTRAGTPVR